MMEISANDSEQICEFVRTELGREPKQPTAMVFDFDGVLADPFEDRVYKLEEWDREREFLDGVSDLWGLQLEGYDTKYVRHLLFQEAAEDLGRDIENGPAYDAAALAARMGSKVYVLTARSGRRAIERVHRFLDALPYEVVEVYHVGRIPKDRQIELFLERLPDHRVYLFEDDQSQIERIGANLSASPNAERYADQVTLVHIAHDEPVEVDAKIRGVAETVVQTAADLRRKVGHRISRPDGVSLDLALGHARELFIYYAGQRITSFRFFMIVMGALAAGLGGVLATDATPIDCFKNEFAIGFGIAIAIASLVFSLLDFRNRQLVAVAEELLIEAEAQLYRSGFRKAQTIRESDKKEKTGRTFGAVFDAVFMYIMIIGILIAVIGLTNLM